jgi:TIR domain
METPTETPTPLRIFVSHGTKYADIADSFKRSLEQVPSSRRLRVELSEHMPVGREWREWIEANVHGADVFVLLYPHPSMDMGWCNYEFGRFYQRDDNVVVCIRNVDIPTPPPVFEPYQSIKADQAGLMQFMEDLFVTGALTKGDVLNANVGKVSSNDGVLANEIARELAEQFAAARVDELLYEKRLVISVNYASTGKLDAEKSIIEGNENGINLLGFHQMPGMTWSDVRNILVKSVEWPMELEQAMPTIASGQLPPPLSPFRTPSGIFIPVIVRAEIRDRELRQVFVIFVPADSERLGALFESSSLPKGMPGALKSLVHILRLMFRARWDILEPRGVEAAYKNPSKERCAEIVRLVLSDYDELNCDLASLNLSGPAAFHDVFDEECWPEIDALSREWLARIGDLTAKPPDNAEELSSLLTALRRNNAKWMNIGATQFTKEVARICKLE